MHVGVTQAAGVAYVERRPLPTAPLSPTSDGRSVSPDQQLQAAPEAPLAQPSAITPWAGLGEALRDRDVIADAWHPESTDDSRAAATAAAPLALGHYAVALPPAMQLNYAVFLEAHVGAHLALPGPLLAWQWHVCAAAWLMDQAFAASPGLIVQEHLEGAFHDMDLLATAARMSFFTALSPRDPMRLTPGSKLPRMRMQNAVLRNQLDRARIDIMSAGLDALGRLVSVIRA